MKKQKYLISLIVLAGILVFNSPLSSQQEDIPTKVKNIIKFKDFVLGDSFSAFTEKINASKLIKLDLTGEGDTLGGIYRTTQYGYESRAFKYLGEMATATFIFNKQTRRLGQILICFKERKNYPNHKLLFSIINAEIKRNYSVASLIGFGPSDLNDMQKMRHFFLCDDQKNLLRVFTAKEAGRYYFLIEYENGDILNQGYGGIGEVTE
ncbi:MAG: hypothetical protein AB1633_10200 [Elusimicrobiota bacterium]